MSRIGRLPITVPAGVTVTIADDNTVTVKGPKGQLSQKVNPDITIAQEGNMLHVAVLLTIRTIAPCTVCTGAFSTTWLWA